MELAAVVDIGSTFTKAVPARPNVRVHTGSVLGRDHCIDRSPARPGTSRE